MTASDRYYAGMTPAEAIAAETHAAETQATAVSPPSLAKENLLLLADVSDPGTEVIRPAQSGPMSHLAAFAFYLGGMTPHVWTPAQIARQILRFAVPVWVYGRQPGAAGGAAEGQDAAATMHSMGIPRGTAIRVDMETRIDTPYLRNFRTAVNLGGYWYGPYGSATTVFENPPGGAGYWPADWIGHPFEYPHPDVWATQYANAIQAGVPWDLSEMRTLAHCWDRRGLGETWTHHAAAGLRMALSDVQEVLAVLDAHPRG